MARKMKVALVGLGDVGLHHARTLVEAEKAELVAVCDVNAGAAYRLPDEWRMPTFTELGTMLQQVDCDGVLIATPHKHHQEATRISFGAGKHVLVEKPLAVRLSDAQAMLQTHRAAEKEHGPLVFGAMFQQRSYGHWKKLKELIDSGELGRLTRVSWTICDWYRSQAYYDSGGWRATWQSEGGGLLMNQLPHNLDIYQWLAGQPRRVTCVAGFGKYHRIEVDDEVSLILEHENGMVGHVYSSTGEATGTSTLEIVGDRGAVLFDGKKLVHAKLAASALETIYTAEERMPLIPVERRRLQYSHHGEPGHRFIIEDFAAAWQEGRQPMVPAAEALAALEISNSSILSAVERRPVELPLDTAVYDALLERLSAGGR